MTPETRLYFLYRKLDLSFRATRRLSSRGICDRCGEERYTRQINNEYVCARCVSAKVCWACGVEHLNVESDELCPACHSVVRALCCRHCSQRINVVDFVDSEYTNHERIICKNCLENTPKCECCGNSLLDNYREIITIDFDNKRKICNLCYRSNQFDDYLLFTCTHCGNYHFITHELGSSYHQIVSYITKCSICSSEKPAIPEVELCEICGKIPAAKDVYYWSKTKPVTICSRCLYTGSWQTGSCKSCEKECLFVGRKGHHDYFVNNYCSECLPLPVFPWNFHKNYEIDDTHHLLYGVELEFDFARLNAREHADALRNAYLHRDDIFAIHDGSLYNGFEIVFDPKPFHKCLETTFVPPVLTIYGENNYETAGTHIHMSLAAFTKGHLYKFLKFLQLCQRQRNRNLFGRGTRFVGSRRGNRYCSAFEERIIDKAKYKTSHESRYVWAHIGNKTVEIRLFSATQNNDELLTRIQFLDAAYHWTQRMNLKVSEYTFKDFLNYLKHHRTKKYNLLKKAWEL